MAEMQQVEAAICEDDAAAVAFAAAKPQNRFLKCQDCRVQRVSMQACTKTKMTPLKKLVYHAREARRPRCAMRARNGVRAMVGVLLCSIGFWLALPTPYKQKTYVINAEGCRLETVIVEKSAGATRGSVVLFHGISANKKIMSYPARVFAPPAPRA